MRPLCPCVHALSGRQHAGMNCAGKLLLVTIPYAVPSINNKQPFSTTGSCWNSQSTRLFIFSSPTFGGGAGPWTFSVYQVTAHRHQYNASAVRTALWCSLHAIWDRNDSPQKTSGISGCWITNTLLVGSCLILTIRLWTSAGRTQNKQQETRY